MPRLGIDVGSNSEWGQGHRYHDHRYLEHVHNRAIGATD